MNHLSDSKGLFSYSQIPNYKTKRPLTLAERKKKKKPLAETMFQEPFRFYGFTFVKLQRILFMPSDDHMKIVCRINCRYREKWVAKQNQELIK